MYFSAARLVHDGAAAQLYTGADTGANPQKLIAPAGSPIYRAAVAEGLPFVGLYVYPPILADLLLPLTFLSLRTATTVWLWMNIAFLLMTALLASRLLRFSALGWQTPLIFVALLGFTPVLQCLHDGQITILLLLLWVAGLILYRDDRIPASAAIFAFATAIKLTPAVVILPLLIWRKWKFVVFYTASLLGLSLLCLWGDTPHASITYVTRVLPAMSGALPALTNYSLAAATERLIAIVQTGSVAPFVDTLPPANMLIGRALSAGALLLLLALLMRAGRDLSGPSQLLVLGLLGLMAPVLSPVSWFHAYATAFIAFALLWWECFQTPVSTGYLAVLTLVSLLLGSAVSENLLTLLAGSPRFANWASYLQFGQMAAASGLVLFRLYGITRHTDLFAPRGDLRA